MNTHLDYPLISCLCVTENRVSFLEKAIACFLNQSYPNKELLVAYPFEDITTTHFLKSFDSLITPLPFENSAVLSLGTKRNMAIQKSSGKYFCVWDDDDWHHPDRLMAQFNALINSDAKSCVLSRMLLYDGATRKSYVSGKRKGWEGTLLCEKAVIDFSFTYADLQKGEDSVLLAALLNHDLTVCLDNPGLYIYTYHGHNTWNRDHWEKNIIGWGRALQDDLSDLVEKIVLDQITSFSVRPLLEDLSLKIR